MASGSGARNGGDRVPTSSDSVASRERARAEAVSSSPPPSPRTGYLRGPRPVPAPPAYGSEPGRTTRNLLLIALAVAAVLAAVGGLAAGGALKLGGSSSGRHAGAAATTVGGPVLRAGVGSKVVGARAGGGMPVLSPPLQAHTSGRGGRVRGGAARVSFAGVPVVGIAPVAASSGVASSPRVTAGGGGARVRARAGSHHVGFVHLRTTPTTGHFASGWRGAQRRTRARARHLRHLRVLATRLAAVRAARVAGAETALGRYLSLVGAGLYPQAFAMEASAQRGSSRQLFHGFGRADPLLHVVFVGPVALLRGGARVTVEYFFRYRHRSALGNTRCRLITGAAVMASIGGQWFYDGLVDGATRQAVVRSPACRG
jgi:hypothetical protein